MSGALVIDAQPLTISTLRSFVFQREKFTSIQMAPTLIEKVRASRKVLDKILEEKKPLYGITTGLGDSSQRFIEPENSAKLQLNLVRYLGCGSGPLLSREVCRAILLIHLKGHSRGYSAVSEELLSKLLYFAEKDWVPAIPREGSLGASGDLVPLSYLARALIGEAPVYENDSKITPSKDLMAENNLKPYQLKTKEGLSLVNGVAAMAGQSLVNLHYAEFLLKCSILSSSWLCLALGGRVDAFGKLINHEAKNQTGQNWVAQEIQKILAEENYTASSGTTLNIKDSYLQGYIQDRYSLRCTPQVLGPIVDTFDLVWNWLSAEVNSTSDNPIISSDGEIAMGGNFYGGYLSQGMDYLKISLANMADLLDRQNTFLVDEKSNRGLPPNLAAWNKIPKADHHLHHGLKGLHQSISAITSEIMAKSIPQSIFSRSSECHNQDKVSLGMGAATQCSDLIDQLFRIQTLHLVCLTQALDIRNIKSQSQFGSKIYEAIRQHIPFVEEDMALGDKLFLVEKSLRLMARENHLTERPLLQKL